MFGPLSLDGCFDTGFDPGRGSTVLHRGLRSRENCIPAIVEVLERSADPDRSAQGYQPQGTVESEPTGQTGSIPESTAM